MSEKSTKKLINLRKKCIKKGKTLGIRDNENSRKRSAVAAESNTEKIKDENNEDNNDAVRVHAQKNV